VDQVGGHALLPALVGHRPQLVAYGAQPGGGPLLLVSRLALELRLSLVDQTAGLPAGLLSDLPALFGCGMSKVLTGVCRPVSDLGALLLHPALRRFLLTCRHAGIANSHRFSPLAGGGACLPARATTTVRISVDLHCAPQLPLPAAAANMHGYSAKARRPVVSRNAITCNTVNPTIHRCTHRSCPTDGERRRILDSDRGIALAVFG